MSDREAELERENAKLRKINRVLMNRVERSMDFQGNAFSLFQTAIVLESTVRERTAALEAALRQLESSNNQLSVAKEREETAKLRLSEAIEAISEGFILCDAADRVVLYNSKYREMWPDSDAFLAEGQDFAALMRHAALSGAVTGGEDWPGWAERRLARHADPADPFVIQLGSGRWIQVSERRTADGGVVGIYTDITEIKVAETLRRERELAEKSVLLQATLDNLSQGVCVFDSGNRLVAWNLRFFQLLDLPLDLAGQGTALASFLGHPAMLPRRRRLGLGPVRLVTEEETLDGRVLEIRANPMPDGGFVATYADITARKRSEEEVRDTERRIRLVTDAMPALIAYVDDERRYRFTNKAYEDWFHRPRSQIDGHSMEEVLGRGLYEKRRRHVDMALAGQGSTFEMSFPVEGRRVEHALATYVPHVTEQGDVKGFFALIQDVTRERQAADQLREAKETLEQRVQERTAELSRTNQALAAATIEAERANLSKTKFLAAASHDLLQPLNAARVFAAALCERRMGQKNRALAENTLAAMEAVDELLGALLDISKLDAGIFNPEVSVFKMAPMLAALRAEHSLQAGAKGLSVKVASGGWHVESDARMLGRILRNLISNAIRYTDRGGILLGCRRQGDDVLVGVWDTGIGIPPDKHDEIFEEFRRLNADGRERGAGLGLAIVRRAARMLDHPLVVRSGPKGSMFGILVPLADEARAPPLAVQAVPPAGTFAGRVVLVVDNEPSVLKAMTALLEGWGCVVLPSSSAAEAVARLNLSKRRPDLIVADYHLDQGETGLAAIARVREESKFDIPALVVTADHASDILADVRGQGYHLLNKPVKPARLRSLMAHLLGAPLA
jgi:PAS domain S-box-containing protein